MLPITHYFGIALSRFLFGYLWFYFSVMMSVNVLPAAMAEVVAYAQCIA
jgi:hypothetical protein